MTATLFVGSNNGDAPGGLRTFAFDTKSGSLSETSRVDDARNPIYFEQSADGNFLYVSEDVHSCGDAARPGGISVYLVAKDGSLARLASYPVAPTVPCHLSLSADGRFLCWAEYRCANFGVMAIGADGLLEPVLSRHHEGHGPNPDRQDTAHCHYARLSPDNQTLHVCDLGLDRVFAYAFDPVAGTLEPTDRDFVAPPGSGPRHLAFLPKSDLAFLVTELSSEIFSLRIRPDAPPECLDRHSLLPPEGFNGATKAAAIRISPAWDWVLASNRGHDSIAAFRIDPSTGRLEPGAISPLEGHFPRDFTFSPDGRFVVVGHKLSNEIAVYSFDARTGALSRVPDVSIPMTKPLRFAFFV